MVSPQVISLHKFGVARSLLLGSGLAYAIEKEQYMHLPIVIVFPTVYAGYHLYKNKEQLF